MQDIGGQSLQEYRKQYEGLLDRMIAWSEYGGLTQLGPHYLGLHESQIGLFGPSSVSQDVGKPDTPLQYRMSSYIIGFMNFITPLRQKIDKIIFCYSWEPKAQVPAEDCNHDKFYYFTFDQVPGHENLQAQVQDFKHGNGNASTLPDLKDINELASILSECDHIQPYILRYSPETNEVVCTREFIDGTQTSIENLIEEFKKRGAYQFSIYGFRWRREKDTPVSLLEIEKMVLQHTFVTHILTWNHDLNSAHNMKNYVNAQIKHLNDEWDQLTRAFRNIMAETIFAIDEGSIPRLPTDGRLMNVIFPKEIHNATHMPDKFNEFILSIENLSDSHPELVKFLGQCGYREFLKVQDQLSQDEKINWSRGIFLALKLLTRHIEKNEKNANDLLPDQVFLAVLRGLAEARASMIPIRFTYSLVFPEGYETPNKNSKCLLHLAGILDSDTGVSRLWHFSNWKTKTEVDGRGVDPFVEWAYAAEVPQTNGGSNALTRFVRDGLMNKIVDFVDAKDKKLPYITLPNITRGKYRLDDLVNRITDFVYTLGLQSGELAGCKDPVILREVRVAVGIEPVTPLTDDCKLNSINTTHLEVNCICTGILRTCPKSEGSFWKPINRLCNCVGGFTPNRFLATDICSVDSLIACVDKASKVTIFKLSLGSYRRPNAY